MPDLTIAPGMVASRQALLAVLAAHGPQAGDVTDVVFSHHHPDHTVNAALFPAARIHDHWAAPPMIRSARTRPPCTLAEPLLLSFATVIVPGHGAAFRPARSTPR